MIGAVRLPRQRRFQVEESLEELAAQKPVLALGFRTAFVHRRTEHGPTQTTDLRPARDWDVVAEDFIDLAEQLGC